MAYRMAYRLNPETKKPLKIKGLYVFIGGNGKFRQTSRTGREHSRPVAFLHHFKVLALGLVTRYTARLIAERETPKRTERPCMV